jgi:hypothetical protein
MWRRKRVGQNYETIGHGRNIIPSVMVDRGNLLTVGALTMDQIITVSDVTIHHDLRS